MTRTVEYTHHFQPAKYSEVVKEVFYNANSKELYVVLHSGTIAGYHGVWEDEYNGFCTSASAGQYWNWYIKGKYNTLSGDVNFVPYEETSSDAVMKNPEKTFNVTVAVNGELRFTVYNSDIVSATKNVHELIEKSFVSGAFYVKEVKEVE